MAQQQPEPEEARTERWTPAGPIKVVRAEEREGFAQVEALETRAAATAADAAPLGLAGFAAATFTVSAVNAGWVPADGFLAAVPILFFFGGLTQFIAGMWAFRKGNTFAATAFGSFGAFNTLFSIGILLAALGVIPLGAVSTGIIGGITLAMFGLIAAYLAVAARTVSPVLVAVLGFLAVTYGLLAGGLFLGAGAFNLAIMAGGYAGMVSSLLAFYASAAIVINSTWRREVLPY